MKSKKIIIITMYLVATILCLLGFVPILCNILHIYLPFFHIPLITCSYIGYSGIGVGLITKVIEVILW